MTYTEKRLEEIKQIIYGNARKGAVTDDLNQIIGPRTGEGLEFENLAKGLAEYVEDEIRGVKQGVTSTEKILAEFVEEGADLEHNRWARWHKYSRLMATPAHIEMWDRKAEMPYIALTNEEQESDRKETRNYLPLLEKAITQAIAEERKMVLREMKEYPKKLFELTNGKMPWVIWQGKADEEEKFTLYKLGFEDAIKILSLQYKPLHKIYD